MILSTVPSRDVLDGRTITTGPKGCLVGLAVASTLVLFVWLCDRHTWSSSCRRHTTNKTSVAAHKMEFDGVVMSVSFWALAVVAATVYVFIDVCIWAHRNQVGGPVPLLSVRYTRRYIYMIWRILKGGGRGMIYLYTLTPPCRKHAVRIYYIYMEYLTGGHLGAATAGRITSDFRGASFHHRDSTCGERRPIHPITAARARGASQPNRQCASRAGTARSP
jgi:hypothetical protein